MTRYLGIEHLRQLSAQVGLLPLLRQFELAIQSEFMRWPEFNKSARLAQYGADGVIELMPVANAEHFSFKYVNGHPKNPQHGLPTVMAFGVLADMKTGYPILLSELTLTTALRTAAMSLLAARVLARHEARCMAVIGNGAQSEFQAIGFVGLAGIRELRCYDSDPAAMHKLAHNLRLFLGDAAPSIKLCSSAREAARDADIVTTLTATPERVAVLTRDMLAPGTHVNAVGGDSPGKTELHEDVLNAAHIFVEYLPQTRVEGELQGRPAIAATELWEVLTGIHAGRPDDTCLTVFDSVGFALEDYAVLRVLYSLSNTLQIGSQIDLIAAPSSPKNLFEWWHYAPSEPSPDKARAPSPCI